MVFISPAHAFEYNSLVSVEEADRIFRSRASADDFLDRAGELLVRAGLEDLLAIRLLHKHNDIGANEIMLERLEPAEGTAGAVVTQKTRIDAAGRSFVPNIWKCFADGGVQALEFTTASMDGLGDEFFERHRDFFAAFHALTAEFGLEDTLGIALRTFKLDVSDHEALVEHVEADRVANVVEAELRSTLVADRIIQTTWEYTNHPTMGCKKMYCSNECKIIGGGQSHDPYHGYVHVGDD